MIGDQSGFSAGHRPQKLVKSWSNVARTVGVSEEVSHGVLFEVGGRKIGERRSRESVLSDTHFNMSRPPLCPPLLYGG